MLQNITYVPERSWFRRVLQGVLNAVAAIGTIWIVAIMFLIVADVFGRNFLAMPIIGVAEIAARSVVAIVFLMLPAAALNGSLIRADFLQRGLRYLAPSSVEVLDAIFALVGALIFLLVAVAAWPDTVRSLQSAEFFGVRGVWTLPTFPFRLIVVFGSASTSLAFAVSALGCLSDMHRSKAS
ncbi:TRAP transporter small permease subunit [Labrenzia sp. DG1229]|uniref:TRAP transporter small permease subunit n=1 Tax=Labrenzia sp. DG1229 TaxID=681847 RepID=UPI000691C7DE|nr:TRAP transporter small permease subunit [Labrenzia sp. DG1229]